MPKAAIEITVDETTDVYRVQSYLLKMTGIKKIGIVTMQSIRVYYDDLKIQAKKIVKAVGNVDNKRHRKRKNNVVSVKEAQDEKSILIAE